MINNGTLVVAGASVSDFIIAYTLHGSVIVFLQVILLMVSVFAIIGVCLYCHRIILNLIFEYRLKELEIFSYMLCLFGCLV